MDCDYDELFNPIRGGRQLRHGKQPGCADELARLVLELAAMDRLSLQVVVGRNSYDIVVSKLVETVNELEEWKPVDTSIAG